MNYKRRLKSIKNKTKMSKIFYYTKCRLRCPNSQESSLSRWLETEATRLFFLFIALRLSRLLGRFGTVDFGGFWTHFTTLLDAQVVLQQIEDRLLDGQRDEIAEQKDDQKGSAALFHEREPVV